GSADQPSGRGADAAERAPDPQRLVALGALLEGGGDDRERGRGHDRRPDPLEGACSDQRLARPGEPAEKRGEREDDNSNHEDTAPAEQVGGAPAEEEQAGGGKGGRRAHPPT